MNYLAHLHIAKVTQTSYVGNLLGDFVKGSVENLAYDHEIKQGVSLHRSVDSFTDKHFFTRELKQTLGEYRRYGGIVLDVFYDHQLATQFHEFDTDSLEEFSQRAYQSLDLTPLTNQGYCLPERFINVVNGMTAMDWLSGYQHMPNIERALIGISRRLKRPIDLTQLMPWYLDNHSEMANDFRVFYQELLDFAQSQT